MILDGFGVREESADNAIAHAETPFWDYISGRIPPSAALADELGPVSYATLVAVGEPVGMPEGAKGSTAVGHEVLSGVDYRHPMFLIQRGIEDGEMKNPVIDDAINYALERGSALHLMGLVSDNREHSDIEHLYAILARAIRLGQKKIRLHFFSDGRGAPPHSGPHFAGELTERIARMTGGDGSFDIRFATLGGRDMTMNRSTQYWTNTVSAFRAIVEADAPRRASVGECFDEAYALGLNDQYVSVAVVGDYAGMENFDSIIHFNFRRDRGEMLMRLFVEPEERLAQMLRESGDEAYVGASEFKKAAGKGGLDFSTIRVSGLVEYYKGIGCPVAFRAEEHEWSLGRMLEEYGYRQKFISGVDKAAALKLLNGAEKSGLYPGQESIVVALPEEMARYIGEYDLHKGEPGCEENPYVRYPLVEIEALTETIVKAVAAADVKTFIAVNVCNPDMVGHTGDMDACVKCVEAIDPALLAMARATIDAGGVMVITADHGNIEEIATDGRSNTYHTRAKVPFAVLGTPRMDLRDDGTLKDVAPTLLWLMLGGERSEVRRRLIGRVLRG